ncbi:MAG: radical SAM protein [Chloroflexota bacterium]
MARRTSVERLRKGLGLGSLVARGTRFLARPDPRRVMWLNYAVTYLCNSRCLTCNIWKKYRETPELFDRELNLVEVKETFSSSRYLRHLEGIGLTGGEPFLRRDFVELAGFFIGQCPDALISVATNGLETQTIVQKTKDILARYSPRFFGLSVSLDGIGKVHDQARGVGGAYERVMATLDALGRLDGVQVGLDYTITPHNYRDMPKVYGLAHNRGFKFLASFAHNSSSYYGNEETQFTWSDQDLDELRSVIDEVVEAKVRNESPLLKVVDPHAYFLLKIADHARNNKRMFRCYSGTHSLFLDPYGNIYPCVILDRPLGNIRDTKFDTLWLSPQAAEVRESIMRNECNCWVACEAVPSLMRGLGVVAWNARNKFRPQFWSNASSC